VMLARVSWSSAFSCASRLAVPTPDTMADTTRTKAVDDLMSRRLFSCGHLKVVRRRPWHSGRQTDVEIVPIGRVVGKPLQVEQIAVP
jgi:hypothetical protein